LEKGKEPATKKKEADEERYDDNTKFVVHLLKSAFRKLQDVGEAFDIKVHHQVDKDPSTKGLAFRIHGLAEQLENLPVAKRDGLLVGDNDDFDGDDSSHDGDDGGTLTVVID
jgi:hypothetical protein